jgi:alpha-galactosidase
MPTLRLALALAALLFVSGSALPAFADDDAKPLRIYILAGQSNMEGHANVKTFGYLGTDPKTAHLLEKMTDAEGKPVTAERVYVSNFNGFFDNNGVVNGKLTAGFGARRNPTELGQNIGPEYTFGLRMQEAYDGPILIIKTAWGGKSLHTDFRPPSAGPYTLNDWQKEIYPTQQGHGIPKDFAQWKKDKQQATGVYYRMMVEHVNEVLADPGKIVPEYDKDAGYELAGFVWFQGWNDLVDSHTYQWAWNEKRYDLYSRWLSLFIKDVRDEFNAPKMPFVIGVMGVGGVIDENTEGYEKNSQVIFRRAMAEPARTMDRVAAVRTALYWDKKLGEIDANRQKIRQMSWRLKNKDKNGPNAEGQMSDAEIKAYLDDYSKKLITLADEAIWNTGASNAAYHYLGSAKIMAQIGEAFAEAILEME